MDIRAQMREWDSCGDGMTPGERMAAYNQGEEVDHIPFVLPGGDTVPPMYGYTVGEYRRSFEVQCTVLEHVRRDFCAARGTEVGLGLKGIGEALGSKVKYPEHTLDYVEDFVLKEYDMLPELVARFIPSENPFLLEKLALIRRYKERFGPDFPVSTSIAGPLTTAVSIRKTEFVMKDMIKNKARLHELLDLSVRCSIRWLELVTAEFGPTAAGLADPAASMSLISERQFRAFCKPHLEDLLAGFKRVTGAIPGIHICGKSKPIWMDLLELGIPSFSVDNCEDLAELKAAAGDRMSISGNVPPVEVMRNGTVEDVIASVQQCLIKGSDSPLGYTLCTGCQIPIGTPVENIRAFVYAARRYGRGARKGQLCRGLLEEGLI